MDSTVRGSTVFYTLDIIYMTIRNSTVIYSTIRNSIVINSTVNIINNTTRNSTSTVQYSAVIDSSVGSRTSIDSNVKDSTVTDSSTVL